MASVAHLPRVPRSLFFDIHVFAPSAFADAGVRRCRTAAPSPPGRAAAAAPNNCADRRRLPTPPPSPSLPQAEAQEPVDPKPRIEKECHKPCERQWAEYDKCKLRIAKAKEGSCEPWVFDYW